MLRLTYLCLLLGCSAGTAFPASMILECNPSSLNLPPAGNHPVSRPGFLVAGGMGLEGLDSVTFKAAFAAFSGLLPRWSTNALFGEFLTDSGDVGVRSNLTYAARCLDLQWTFGGCRVVPDQYTIDSLKWKRRGPPGLFLVERTYTGIGTPQGTGGGATVPEPDSAWLLLPGLMGCAPADAPANSWAQVQCEMRMIQILAVLFGDGWIGGRHLADRYIERNFHEPMDGEHVRGYEFGFQYRYVLKSRLRQELLNRDDYEFHKQSCCVLASPQFGPSSNGLVNSGTVSRPVACYTMTYTYNRSVDSVAASGWPWGLRG